MGIIFMFLSEEESSFVLAYIRTNICQTQALCSELWSILYYIYGTKRFVLVALKNLVVCDKTKLPCSHYGDPRSEVRINLWSLRTYVICAHFEDLEWSSVQVCGSSCRIVEDLCSCDIMLSGLNIRIIFAQVRLSVSKTALWHRQESFKICPYLQECTNIT